MEVRKFTSTRSSSRHADVIACKRSCTCKNTVSVNTLALLIWVWVRVSSNSNWSGAYSRPAAIWSLDYNYCFYDSWFCEYNAQPRYFCASRVWKSVKIVINTEASWFGTSLIAAWNCDRSVRGENSSNEWKEFSCNCKEECFRFLWYQFNLNHFNF